MFRGVGWGWVLLILVLTAGCSLPRGGMGREAAPVVYSVLEEVSGGLIERFAPAFVVHSPQDPWNRIGRPSARAEDGGEVGVFVDPEKPMLYTMTRRFSTDRGEYTNLVYRVHFEEVPYRLVPFHLTAGKNVGLLVVVTLDTRERPVLLTTVNTCGCYVSIQPFSDLPRDALPEAWTGQPLDVFGETLAAMLDASSTLEPRLLIHLRPDVHRVMEVEVVASRELQDGGRFAVTAMQVAPMKTLERLPVPGGGHTSFFSNAWVDRGHVKASYKIWETLLMSWWSLDFFVGSDKAYKDTAVTGNPFYTSLKPWNREASDMWHFDRFLRFWGWRL